MKYLLILLSLSFLESCATTSKYEAVLQTWVGKNESELVSKWGIPTSSYSLDDGKLIMYQNNGGSISTYLGYGMYSTDNYVCKTTFTLDKANIIKNWKWEGNSCKSK
jgi:hypothetical protein